MTFVLLIHAVHPIFEHLTSPHFLTVLPRLTVPVFLAPNGTPEPPEDPPFFAPSGTPEPAGFFAGADEGLLAEEGSLLTPGPEGNLLTDPLVAAAADLVAVPVAGFFAAAGEGFGKAFCAGAGGAFGCDFGALYIGRPKACCPPVLLSLRPRGLLAVPVLGTTAPV